MGVDWSVGDGLGGEGGRWEASELRRLMQREGELILQLNK
jgi:hypothetical protein